MYPGSEVSKFLSRLARGWPTAAVVVTAFGLQAVAATNATHWAFQPLVRPAFPAGKYSNAIDAFVSSALAKKDRALAPEADRRKLIRRLSFDLRGLPPSPEEVSHFLKDTRPGAFERLVQNFLGSPQYGERWGRHWLDIVGYADSNGYFNADSDRPLAWKFRDYVVRSIAADKPLDRFIQEQIAGDELAGYVSGGDVTPEMIDPLIATHFWRNAPDGTGESDGNPLEVKVDRYAVLEGNVQIVGSAFLGLTLQCARCHDHKFEPVTQADYYGLQAILRPAFDPERWLKPNERAIETGLRSEREAHQRRTAEVERDLKTLKESLEGLTAPFRKQLLDENLAPLDASLRTAIQKALETKEKQRTDEMKALLKTNAALVDISAEALEKKFPTYAAAAEPVRQAIKKREREKPPPLERIAATFEPTNPPAVHHLLVRGNHAKEGKEIAAAIPAVFNTVLGDGLTSPGRRSGKSEIRNPKSERNPNNGKGRKEESADEEISFQVAGNLGDGSTDAKPALSYSPAADGLKVNSSGRRLALARWLTSSNNPIVARVLVNRVWQYHFGQGLVSTVDNLGQSGARPVCPELLDWLASELIRSGWSLKHLHRLILNSATWRQACDPLNNDSMMTGSQPRRLDAESLRDAMLAVSGELDLTSGGPYVPTTTDKQGQVIIAEKQAGACRRSIYLQQRRSAPVGFLSMFDGPAHNPVCIQRVSSTVASQSLSLLNSEFVHLRARAFAKRVLATTRGTRSPSPHPMGRGTGRGASELVTPPRFTPAQHLNSALLFAFDLAYSRPPTKAEFSAAKDFVNEQNTIYKGQPDVAVRVWTDLCQMLLASNAFLYVD